MLGVEAVSSAALFVVVGGRGAGTARRPHEACGDVAGGVSRLTT
ncbi:MAG TPA: hypothetical protein VL769_04260 [Acidimicrobiia bacterium]|nr:hypothetical protein [Acidimicrobiia bacterium]